MQLMQPLDDIRLKVDRAREHIDSLDGRIVSFLRENPYEADIGYDAQAHETVFRFKIHALPDDSWGVIVGDAAHNLRSALEHIAYYIVARNIPNPGQTGFPIVKRRRAFTTSKLLSGASAGALAAAESLQPYNSRNWPEVGLLEVLRVLNNRDKHVVITPVFISPRAEIPGRSIQRFGVLRDGDEVRVRFQPDEQPHGQFFTEVAFVVPDADPITIGTLKGIHEFIRDEVVPRFSNFL